MAAKNLKIFDLKKGNEELQEQVTTLTSDLAESESIRFKHNRILEKNKEVL